tara:strand:+ start:249 stop:1067 length:819 start_codon:yes stop_codon:yes gene_type:complete
MKKILVFLSFISSSFIAVSQLDFSLNSLYSSSLSNFKKDSYSSGFGVKFGLSHIHMGSNNMGLETGFDWIISNNGKETTGLPLGIYTLSNSWYNWQFKLNGIFEYNKLRYYFGINAGRAIYYTYENLDFDIVQEDNSTYWSQTIKTKNISQYGAQIGMYIEPFQGFSFDFGMSILKGREPVDYIDFNSFTFDGQYIDYNEKISSPFLFTLNAGLKIDISWLRLGDFLSQNTSYFFFRDRSDSDCSSQSESSGSKSNSKGKLYKDGKTPVKYE